MRIQGATLVEAIVAERKQPQPYILATGTLSDPKQMFLIVDCVVIGEIKVEQLALIIFTAYFVFNISYVKGCCNMFSFLEVLFCKSNADKASSTVRHFITALNNH